MTLENKFQASLIKEIKKEYPGCVILKNDAQYFQGILDILILFEDKWAMLEVKASKNSPHQPNQDFYVDKFSRMSYASFIYPENKERVLDELQRTFRPDRPTRLFRA
jgi:Holliday junction resolvase-like predicted endonuclease